MSKPAPVAVALDAPDLETAARWAALVTPHVSTVKVGRVKRDSHWRWLAHDHTPLARVAWSPSFLADRSMVLRIAVSCLHCAT